jgi:hypothetical protein
MIKNTTHSTQGYILSYKEFLMFSSLNYMVATNPSHSFVVGWDGTGPSLCPIKTSTLYRSSIKILYFLELLDRWSRMDVEQLLSHCSKMTSHQLSHVEWVLQRWPMTLTHMHICNDLRRTYESIYIQRKTWWYDGHRHEVFHCFCV